MVPYVMFTRADLGDLAHQQALHPRLWFWNILNTHRRNLESNVPVRLGLAEPLYNCVQKEWAADKL